MAPRLVESCFFISKDVSTGGVELLEVDQKDIFKIAPFINNVTSRSVEKSGLAPLISKLHSVVFGKPINEIGSSSTAVNTISQQQNELKQLRETQRDQQLIPQQNNQFQNQTKGPQGELNGAEVIAKIIENDAPIEIFRNSERQQNSHHTGPQNRKSFPNNLESNQNESGSVEIIKTENINGQRWNKMK